MKKTLALCPINEKRHTIFNETIEFPSRKYNVLYGLLTKNLTDEYLKKKWEKMLNL